ncbi:MAG: hypothetical protein IKQ66_04755 [Treponema sp.]|nr:hypothetical protein [Treponema sp.]MBR6193457.1 hypothetical protein [Treponema sp.]
MALRKRLTLFLTTALMAFLGIQSAAAQKTVDFFSTVSSSEDTDMIDMTTNLFFTQMQGLDGYIVTDKRDREFTGTGDFTADLAFFAEIQEIEGGWMCTLNTVDRQSARAVQETKTYASYYKILLDAKSSLENVLNNIDSQSSEKQGGDSGSTSMQLNLDTLAGTWTGDSLIDKIVILRGGKGFVIFKNGASMNITVAINGNAVTVIQKGRSNASFYPELTREVALQNAATASPIRWDLKVIDSQKMTGTKTTLAEDKKSSTGASAKTSEVEWTKME